MEIIKSYDSPVLGKCESFLKHSILEKDVRKVFDRLEGTYQHLVGESPPLQKTKKLLFNDYSDKFNIKQYSREIDIVNLLYEKLFKNKYDHDKFAELFENSNIKFNKSKMKSFYPEEWTDSLIFYDLSFLSYAILQFFENECDKYIKMKSKDNKFVINIAYSSNVSSNETINKIIYHIYNILNWIIDLGDAKVDQFRLDIILCPFEKTFTYEFPNDVYERYEWLKWTRNMKDDAIKAFNINTGLSWIGTNHIVLFRSDELFKVLFHECIHSLKYDLDDNRDCMRKSCEKMLKDNVKLKVGQEKSYPILINEGYTEYMAIVCWNYYVASYYFVSQNKKVKDKFKLYYHMIQREQVNSAIMCAKLFDYYKIKDLTVLNRQNYVVQKTNAFSYILVKYIFLINMVGILEDKSAKMLNEILVKEFDNIKKYNYLLDMPIDGSGLLKLSLYHLKFLL